MAVDVKAGKVKTVQGGELEIATEGGVTINGAKVVKTDIVGKNGVIHVIDTVVLPKKAIFPHRLSDGWPGAKAPGHFRFL